jgi:hypothetical protein
MGNDDMIFREIADIYEKRYGSELITEAEKLNEQGASESEMRLKQRLFEQIRAQEAKRKRRIYMSVIVAAAACIILFISVPNMLDYGSESAVSAPVASLGDPVSYEVIPLSADLPYGFVQAGFEQDREKSVYYIEDIYSDDVVLTIEESEETIDDSRLTYVSLGDTDAYGTTTGSYSLLTFKRDSVLYTMTCRYDINTLVRLGKGLA